MTTIEIAGDNNYSNTIINSDSATISETTTSGDNLALPVFANKTYIGKYQSGQRTVPLYVIYKFNKDGTRYNLNFSDFYKAVTLSFAHENSLLTKQNTEPGHVGEYYKTLDSSGPVFTVGYQNTGINFIDNKLFWTPGIGPLLGTSKAVFDMILSSYYDISMAALISQQLELYPSKYYCDPLAWLTKPYMVDSTNIEESDLILQQNTYNINYNLEPFNSLPWSKMTTEARNNWVEDSSLNGYASLQLHQSDSVRNFEGLPIDLVMTGKFVTPWSENCYGDILLQAYAMDVIKPPNAFIGPLKLDDNSGNLLSSDLWRKYSMHVMAPLYKVEHQLGFSIIGDLNDFNKNYTLFTDGGRLSSNLNPSPLSITRAKNKGAFYNHLKNEWYTDSSNNKFIEIYKIFNDISGDWATYTQTSSSTDPSFISAHEWTSNLMMTHMSALIDLFELSANSLLVSTNPVKTFAEFSQSFANQDLRWGQVGLAAQYGALWQAVAGLGYATSVLEALGFTPPENYSIN